jgi:hypothetical protein
MPLRLCPKCDTHMTYNKINCQTCNSQQRAEKARKVCTPAVGKACTSCNKVCKLCPYQDPLTGRSEDLCEGCSLIIDSLTESYARDPERDLSYYCKE